MLRLNRSSFATNRVALVCRQRAEQPQAEDAGRVSRSRLRCGGPEGARPAAPSNPSVGIFLQKIFGSLHASICSTVGSSLVEFPAVDRPFADCAKLATMNHEPCCDDMRRQLEFRCADHADLSDCPDSLVVFHENPATFGIRVHDGGSSFAEIRYCPWCGANLSAQPRVAHPHS